VAVKIIKYNLEIATLIHKGGEINYELNVVIKDIFNLKNSIKYMHE